MNEGFIDMVTKVLLGLAMLSSIIVNSLQDNQIRKQQQQIIEITKQIKQLQQIIENKTLETK